MLQLTSRSKGFRTSTDERHHTASHMELLGSIFSPVSLRPRARFGWALSTAKRIYGMWRCRDAVPVSACLMYICLSSVYVRCTFLKCTWSVCVRTFVSQLYLVSLCMSLNCASGCGPMWLCFPRVLRPIASSLSLYRIASTEHPCLC